MTFDNLVNNLDCSKEADQKQKWLEVQTYIKYTCRIGLSVQIQQFLSDESIIERTRDCDEYFKTMPVAALDDNREGVSDNVKLAFSHSVHHQAGILELFLALFFRPGNYHCLHVDAKVSHDCSSMFILSAKRVVI